ncbi:MAG: hypothetical protein H6741_34455 [Alphaproteobacteria bacterium]|nr:hypothetical protein [Alphaproteobacteria bacterium]
MKRLALTLLLLTSAAYAAPQVLQPNPDSWRDALVAGWSEGAAPEDVEAMRALNPEWDFMSRTFLVLTLAEESLADRERAAEDLAVMDHIIADTLAQEAAHGHEHFLLGYASYRPWKADGRSLFVDGELLVMMGARRLVQDDRWEAEMQARAAQVEASLGAASPLPFAESYPDEGWTFCHAMALTGLRMHEALDGADHGDTTARWLAAAREHLVDADTGLLVSEFDMLGRVHDGVEGSSLWWSLTALRLLDPEWADAQYLVAKEALAGRFMGWSYAKEWPEGAEGPTDIDSGPIVPGLDASASSSGFAILAARAFEDKRWSRQLVGSLGAAQTVMAVHPGLAAAADNPVGQSVITWGLSFGPLWAEIEARAPTLTASRTDTSR